jgi:hypothetical protein
VQFARAYTCKLSIQPLPPALQGWPSSPMNDQQFDQYAARMKAASDAETAREIAAFAMQTGVSQQEAATAWHRADADYDHAYCCSDQGEVAACP